MENNQIVQNSDYSHEHIEKLMSLNPFIKELYKSTTAIVYFGVVLALWFFVYYAYTINVPYEDLRCDDCGFFMSTIAKTLITLWIFSMFFYLLYEIRCRIWDLGKLQEVKIINRTNWLIFGGALAATVYASILLWFM